MSSKQGAKKAQNMQKYGQPALSLGQEAFVQMHSLIAGGFFMLLFLGLSWKCGPSNLLQQEQYFFKATSEALQPGRSRGGCLAARRSQSRAQPARH